MRRTSRSVSRRRPQPRDPVVGILRDIKDSPHVPGVVGSILDDTFGVEELSGDYFIRRGQLINRDILGTVLLLTLPFLGLGCLLLSALEAIRRPHLDKIRAASRATRRRLRAARKKSTRRPPSPETLVAAWGKAHRSLEWRLRIGSMLADLEPVVDQSYIRDETGTIVGRQPGIRGWLDAHCPVVALHYKTAMGYKAVANRFRLAISLPEPFTLEDVLDGIDLGEDEGKEALGKGCGGGKCTFKNSEARKVVETLKRRNRKRGRRMRRSLSELDAILHEKLRLISIPRSA